MKTILQTACLLFLTIVLSLSKGQSQTETISSGAFIINMGATNPNTVANGIKPYGMIYDLLRNYNVPVKWVISQAKLKDGVDFIYNGVQYKGGTFIIPVEYRTSAVNSRIAYWSGQGVVGATTSSDFSVDVTYTIRSYPRWTLDTQNGAIAEGYLINAGITNAAFPAAYNWKSPQTLGSCDDFFVMPHAEPTWATHSNLFAWNRDYFGSIWAACHAVSALENMVNPSNAAEQTNFLTTKDATATLPLVSNVYANSNSLLLWTAHGSPSAPFTTRLPSDPIAQFMGLPDAALIKGSETVFIPRQTGGVARWNSGVKMITYDPSQADVSSLNPDLRNAPALIVYGRAFDDANRGYVMYEAGHSHRAGTVGDIAAQRAFFNFSFFQTTPKAPQLSASGPVSGKQVSNGDVLNFSVSASSPLPGVGFNYQWTATGGGSFSAATSSSTTFTPAATAGTCVVTCTVTDNCGRTSFQSFPITILPSPTNPTVAHDAATISGSCPPGTPITLNVLSNDIPNTSTISFTSLNQASASPASAGTWTSNAGGDVTFTPEPNFNGTATITYTVTNTQNLTSTATISVQVGGTDANGCSPNSVYAPAEVNFVRLSNLVTQSGVSSATSSSTALDDNEATYSSEGTDYLNMGTSASNNVIMSIGSTSALRAKDSINVYWKKNSNTAIGTISVQFASTSVGPWSNTQVFTSNANPSAEVISKYGLPSGTTGVAYIKVSAGNVTSSSASATNVYLDAAEYEYLNCISKDPQLVTDLATLLEDQPTVINVLSNDTDPQGLSLTLKSITSAPSKGKVSINTDGTITYISNLDVSGSDVFSYSAVNSEGYIDTASVSVTITDDGCASGSYKAASSAGSITKVFQYQFAGTNAATGNATSSKFRDTYIRSGSSATSNYVTSSSLRVGYSSSAIRRALYYFDVSEIPSGAVVQSAQFSTTLSSSATSTKSVSVHAMTKAWTDNQVNWNVSQTNSNWTTAGGDFNATALATQTIPTTTGTYTSWDISTQVQSWVSNAAVNYGIIQKAVTETTSSMSIASMEATTNRPKLTVTYVVPVSCAAIPNRAPLANPVYATTLSGQAVTIAPLSSSADVDLNTISLSGVFGNGAGTTATVSGSNIIYTPSTSGVLPRTDRISYIIADNGSGTLKDTAYIYVTVENAAPNVVKDLASTNSGTLVSISVKSNDADPEGNSLAAPTITSNPKYGTAVVNGQNIDYTPMTGYTGLDTLVYQVYESAAGSCSSNPLADTALVVITVNNQTPVAVADSKSGLPCQELKIDLISNDTDAENGMLTVGNISALSTPAAGTLFNNSDGTVTFVPATGYTGSVTFTYTITDDGYIPKTSSAATVTITIASAPNSAPVANGDVADPSNLNETVYYSVLDNDSDPDGNTLSNPVITVAPLHGTATVLSNGLIKYVPNTGYHGTDILTYQICDIVLNASTCVGASTLCDTATLSFTINSAGITISGDLWQDYDGDLLIENGEAQPSTANQLYIHLLDNGGYVLQVTQVGSDGIYTFTDVDPGNTYSLLLSKLLGTVGQLAPESVLPSGWTNTGTSLWGTTSKNTGIIGPIALGYSSISDFNFGIEQLPNSTDLSGTIAKPNLNQIVTLNGGVNPPVLSGTDPEDCTTGCVLTAKSAVIDQVPANAELYYNGILLSDGAQLGAFDPSLFTMKFTAASTDATLVSFKYSFVDAAGAKDQTPATYALSLNATLPVHGLNLTATLKGSVAKLKWTTEQEMNSKQFVIERSLDNVHHVQVGTVSASGNTLNRHTYYFDDDLNGIVQGAVVYYRIREVDLDNHNAYSNVANVKGELIHNISVWPNPFANTVKVLYYAESPETITMKMIGSSGQLIKEVHTPVVKGNSLVSIDNLSTMLPGFYLLKINNQKGELVKSELIMKK